MALPTRRREAATFRPPAVRQPFRERDELQRRTADLMQSVWSGSVSATASGGGARGRPRGDRRTVDRRGEAPGVRRDDVTVELAVRTVRVPDCEQPRSRRVVVQAREA